ncbi:MAG TPA: regulatory protein RecX [Syntrophales bacterium]|nr:regulatory protein RecX [Syntrophales bacterium]
MEKDLLHEKAKQKAFRLLAIRARSEKELRTKLKERGYDESVVGDVMARLREFRYLDDESFARGWARNLAVNRLWGNIRIEASLRDKGIPRELIERVIREIREELSEQKALKKLLKKKEGGRSLKMDVRDKRRLTQSLMGKGFPLDLIIDMLKTPKEDLTDDGG